MKFTQVFAAIVALIGTSSVVQAQSPILPFEVKVGGQAAKASGEAAIFATVAEPVAADAAIEVEGSPAMLIVNVFKCDEKGEVDASASPAVLMVQNSGTVKLDQTMDKKPLAPGTYIANIVLAEKGTSRVLFKIK